MSHRIKKVEHVEDYRLKLHFDDGKIKIVDLSSMIAKGKHLLARLADLDYFKQVKCDGITIVWPNGVDLCPDALYRMGKGTAFRRTRVKRNPRAFKIRKRATVKAR